MELANNIVNTLNDFLSGKLLIILLLGTGLWFTIQTGFIQIRGFGEGMHRMFGGLFSKGAKADKDGMSSFQALATAIAGQVGTGNIAGAATAIAVGGPGAIFWMWIAAFLGMATIFAEAVLAQKYKTVADDGHVTGGPVYYISKTCGSFGKVLAVIFAVLIILALGFMGNAVQSNSIASAFETAFNIPVWATGIVLAILSFLIFSGGMKRIATITENIVPIMAVFYIIGSVIVLIVHASKIPMAFVNIFEGAFAMKSVVGGVAGITIAKAMQKGIARGLFSNEAGMGSTPHAHAVAKVSHPAEQGFVAMIGVFIDTFIILDMTAFVILTSDVLTADGSLTGAALSQAAFSTVFGNVVGPIFIAIALFFFASSTIIGWYFYGEANIKYLFGSKAVKVYSLIVCLCVFAGTFGQVDLIWNMSDCFNSLMVLPNVIGLLGLWKIVKDEKIDYYKKSAK